METVHYLILGGAAALTLAILFPGFGAKAKSAVQTAVAAPPAPGNSARSAFREMREAAESLADERIASEIVDKLADRRKAEFQGLFAFDQAATKAKP